MATATKRKKAAAKKGATIPADRLEAAADSFVEQIFGNSGKNSARNGDGASLDPGRFGTKSTSLPDGIALVEARQRDNAKQRAAGSGELADVSVHIIKPNPFQPRKEFNKAGLDELAASIEANGLLQRVILRKDPKSAGAFQLVAGECRLRSVQQLGWPTIPAEVREYSDAQMHALAIVENTHRNDLNPLELALSCQKLIDEQGLIAADLEKIFGWSQAKVSNHLRLLKLPKEWQQRVAAGELSLTHVRAIMPYADYPAILKEVADQLEDDDLPGTREFEQSVYDAVRFSTRDIKQGFWNSKTCNYVKPKLTDEQFEKLAVIEVVSIYNKKDVEQRATNVKLFDQICKEQSAKAPAEKKTDTKKARKPTAAETKRAAEQRAQQLKARLSEWRANWLRLVLSRRFGKGLKCDEETMWRLLLVAANRGTHHKENIFATSIEEATGTKTKIAGFYFDIWKYLRPCGVQELADIGLAFVRNLFWHKVDGIEQPTNAIDNEDIEWLAGHLKLNLAAEWKERKAGPLTQAFYNLFDKSHLEELAEQHGLKPFERVGATKAMLVEALANDDGAFAKKLPKEIAPVKSQTAKEPKR